MPPFPVSIDLSALDGVNGFRITDQEGAVSVASAGDLNGDGIEDVIVGFPYADPIFYDEGVSDVVFGTTGGFPATIAASTLDGTDGFRLTGAAWGRSGKAVASAGDVNGDGIDDVIVGAYYASPHGQESGAAYVVFGRAGGYAATSSLGSLDGTNGFMLSGRFTDEQVGFSVSRAGDVNGDGYDDVIVGTHNLNGPAGTAYVVFGGASGFPANIDLSSLDGSNGFAFLGMGGGYSGPEGTSVAAVGDLNGDGYDDVIIGAPNTSYWKGMAYVVYGRASGFAPSLYGGNLDGTNGFRISGGSVGELGVSVAAGDVNGDGRQDLIVGARGTADRDGVVYILLGTAEGFAASVSVGSGSNVVTLIGRGNQSAGYAVATGDVNGDGIDDVIVGAPDSPSGASQPATYVIYGSTSGLSSGSLENLNGLNGFKINGRGESVAVADVNHDGFGDVLVAGGYRQGASVVYGHSTAFNGRTVAGTSGPDGLVGTTRDDYLSGQGGDDTLTGRSGSDWLDGGSGVDTMIGGDGDDSYLVDNALDVVIEGAGGGNDRILASADYALADGTEVETLRADGTGGRTLIGNAFDNTLEGGVGADRLFGAAGNDVLLGGDGNDVLDGGTGADVMHGGDGGDTYYVDNPLDIVDDSAFGYSYPDVVFTSVDYTLAPGSGIETLTANAGSIGLRLDGNGSAGRINGGDGNDTLRGKGGSLYGNGGDDTLVVRNGDPYFSSTYDGGAGNDTLLLGNAVVADFTSGTFAGIEHFVGSSGDDQLTFKAGHFFSFGTFDAGAGADSVTVEVGGTIDASANAGPTITSLESLVVLGANKVADVLTLNAQQFAGLSSIDLGGGASTDKLAVVVNDVVDLTAAFPEIRRVEQVSLRGSGAIRLSVSELGQFTSIAASLAVTLADRGNHLQTAIAVAIGKGVDILDATNDLLSLTAVQYQALGGVQLTAADVVSYQDTGANIAALTPSQIGALAAKGIDRLDAVDGTLALSVGQLQALGSIVLASSDAVTLADTGAHIAALTAPQISALSGQGIDMIDAFDDALVLGVDQFTALGKTMLSEDDALTLTGTAGADKIAFSSQPFGAADRIGGGAGTDTLSLAGDYGNLVFQADTITGIEKLLLGAGHDYGLTLADGNVDAARRLTVSAAKLGTADSLAFDGSAESDGSFAFKGGAGGDTLTGGNCGDSFMLGAGADLVRYTAAVQSTSTGYDTVTGFDAALDHLHVSSGVVAVDAPLAGGRLSTSSFDADLAAAMGSLLAHHAALFTPDAGGLAGQRFLVVDADGVSGYQAGSDLVIRLDGAAHLDQFGAATFV